MGNDDTEIQGPTLLDAMPKDLLDSVVDETDQSPLNLISDRSVVEEMIYSNPEVNVWMSDLENIQEYIDEDEPEIKSMLESETADEMTHQEFEFLSQLENATEPQPIIEDYNLDHDNINDDSTSQTEVIQTTSNNNGIKIQDLNLTYRQYFVCYKQM